MKRLRIIILCSDGPHHRYLVAAMQAKFQVEAVFVEPDRDQCQALRAKGKWTDYAYRLYHRWRHRLFHARYRRYFFANLPPTPPDSRPLVQNVASINDPAVTSFVGHVGPDVTIVMGTSILRRPLLRAAGPVVLNIHGGYLPDYRGNNCFFFALYQGRLDRIGSTLHFVTDGVDRGDIIEVIVPKICFGDTPESLYCQAEKMAIDRLAHWLEQLQVGSALPRKAQESEGHLFRTRDRKVGHEIVFWIRYWWLRLTTPPTAAQTPNGRS